MSYAEGTAVPIDRSKAEIESTLMRYGADQFMTAWDSAQGFAVVGFRFAGRYVQMRVKVPDPHAAEFTTKRRSGSVHVYERAPAEARKLWEQAQRQRWRALALVIKAKLEAIEAGISTFEEEFLAWTMLPNGVTVGEWAEPQLIEVYASGKMPPMLPGPGREGAR